MATHAIPAIEAQPRQRTGTRYAQRDRAAGLLPAVIYGHGKQPVHVTVDAKSFVDILHDEARLIDVSVAGESDHCLVRDVQWDHLGRHIIHVDLTRVDLSEEVEVEVELELKGEPTAIKDEDGAVVDQQIVMIEIACRADSIPEHLTHDITGLQIGEPLTIGDLVAPEGIRFTGDPETVVASIQFTKEVEEDEAAEAAEGEPEVIGAKDDEGDGD